MTAAESPRPSTSGSAGGAPAPGRPVTVRVATVLGALEQHVEDLGEQTVGALEPYLDDLAEAEASLRAVLERLGDGGPRTGRALLAVAEAVGVLEDAEDEGPDGRWFTDRVDVWPVLDCGCRGDQPEHTCGDRAEADALAGAAEADAAAEAEQVAGPLYDSGVAR